MNSQSKIQSLITVPTVIENMRDGTKVYNDIFSRLLKDRIVFITGEINMDLANIVIAELIYLEKESSTKDIQVYIQSVGGNIQAGLAIYDTFNYIKPDVVTIGMGIIASMASILLAGGTKGKRYALPNTRIMIHQPLLSGTSRITASDLEITTKELLYNKRLLIEILSKHTGQKESKITKDIERDFWMSAQEAKKYGIIDKVL